MGKVTVFAGESGAGKSYICAGNIVKAAQDQDIFVVLIDSENALDESWLHALDVDTSEEKLLKLNMSMIDDVAKTISTFMTDYKAMNEDERPKVLFVIDSLGMLLTPTDVDQFNKGDMKGDMGRKPKALTSLVRNTVNMIGSHNVGLVCTNHTYASQDMFDPDDKISGGQGFIYASSIVVAMKKLKLKEDEDGNKISQVMGIRAGCKVMKTRYAKPFEGVQVKIPYETGMNPYSGLLELFEAKDIIKKQGNRLAYTTLDGEEILDYRKKWVGENLDKVMSDYLVKESQVVNTAEVDDEEATDDNLIEEAFNE
jgi:RecA/RadA recombinase